MGANPFGMVGPRPMLDGRILCQMMSTAVNREPARQDRYQGREAMVQPAVAASSWPSPRRLTATLPALSNHVP
jgi:hypothetical protein